MITTLNRAKRRNLAIAIIATTIFGTKSLDLALADEKLVQTPVSEMSKVPAVRSVGIRLVNPSGTTNKISSLATPPEVLSRSAPIGVSTELPLPSTSVPPRPSSEPEPLASAPGLAASAPNLPTAPSLPSLPLASQPQQKANSTVASDALLAPPPMPLSGTSTENQTAPNPNGRVLVKLAPDSFGQKTSAKLSTDMASQVSVAVNHEPIRVSLNDNSAQTANSKQRVPELVKAKPTQLSKVTVAETAAIALPGSDPIDSTADSFQTSPPNLPTVPAGDEYSSAKSTKQNKPIASPVGFASLVPTLKSDTQNHSRETANVASSASAPRKSFDPRLVRSAPAATVELECQSATAMDIPGSIKSVSVQDEEVCRVIHNEKSISFVGDKSGSTLIQVWTGESKGTPLTLRVNVSLPWQKPASSPGDIRDVRQVIAQAFPAARVNIATNDDGTIEVRGTTDTEEQAVRIMEIVRKLCLVPVKDRVTVSR
ncbi:MAG: pilus assembly protein N-terminal domain-containing protein [Pirellula sp.]